MREAILGGLSALDTVRPGKGSAKPRKPAAGVANGAKRNNGNFRRFRTHVALIVGSAGFSAIMIGIVLNATVMQKEHHPAPLFGAAAAPAPARVVVPAPLPAPVDVPTPAPAVQPPSAPVAPAAALQPSAVIMPAGKPIARKPVHASTTIARTAPAHPASSHVGPSHLVPGRALPLHRADPIGQLIGQSRGADLHQRTAHAMAKPPVAARPKTLTTIPRRTIPVAVNVTGTAGAN